MQIMIIIKIITATIVANLGTRPISQTTVIASPLGNKNLKHVYYSKNKLGNLFFQITVLDMFLFVGLIVFGMEKKNIFDEEWFLGWTYYVTIFDLIFTFLTTIYFFFLRDNDKPSKSIFSQQNQSMQPVMTTQYKRNTQPDRVVVPASFMNNQQSEKERIEIPKSFRPTEQLRNSLLVGGKNESSDRKSFLRDDDSEDESYTVDSYSSTEEETASEATGFV